MRRWWAWQCVYRKWRRERRRLAREADRAYTLWIRTIHESDDTRIVFGYGVQHDAALRHREEAFEHFRALRDQERRLSECGPA